MLSLTEIAKALGGKIYGREVRAPGPGHSKDDASLCVMISDAGDDIVVKSFADDDPIACKDYVRERVGLPSWQPKGRRRGANGQSIDDEIDAVLAPKKPTPEAKPTPEPEAKQWVCNYDYTDCDGNLLYQVQRFANPKTFKQRRPNGKGGWIYIKVFEGVSRVPYRWPELAADLAIYPDAEIYVTEGEKDADNVRKLGLIATTCAGNVITEQIAGVFRDRDVYILEDNDSKGREKSDHAARALAGIAKTVRIAGFVDLPEKSDVSDWIALDPANHNADALFERCRHSPEFDPNTEAPEADKAEAGEDPLGEWDAGDDTETPQPRGWLLGNAFCRGFISSLIGEGGTGKSALRMAQLLALATGKPLTGEFVFLRCRVLLISLEDDADELRRRLRAACLHHGIEQAELKGWLFLAAPGAAGGKILALDQQGRPVKGKLATKILRVIKQRGIAVVSIDPFVKSHSVEENNNSMIDEVLQVLTDLAIENRIAVDLPHHVAKGAADPGNANRGRGASSMKDAARLVYTLTPMSAEEGQMLGLSEMDRRLLARVDSAKINLVPPWDEAKWFRLVGVNIGNATELYPNGDQVQTVEPWIPPNIFADLANLKINEILTEIDAGLPDGNRYTDAPKATGRAAWRVIAKHCDGKSEAACRKIIRLWLESGLLTRRDYDNPTTRKPVNGLWVDATKRPS
jgi:hypothetical protein